MLWIHGLTVVLLVKVRVKIFFLPAVTAVLLHHSAMDVWTDCSVVSTGWRGNGVSAYRFCNTVHHNAKDAWTDSIIVSRA